MYKAILTAAAVVVLSAKRYIGTHMKCAVLGVYETAGPQGPIYSARMRCSSAAGGARKSARNLIMVRAGADQLSLGSDFDTLKPYQRCVSHKPTATHQRRAVVRSLGAQGKRI